ncbi:MAG: replicative DNA helicase [Clostridia bacterium]|nr:replicative DNA helicase [Clostridia bacterium]
MPEKKPAYNDNLNLPYSLEAEQSVLGSVLIDASCMDLVADMLPNEEYFYLPEHQAVYRVMLQKMMANRTIDFVTVLEDLKSEGFYAGEEGKTYLYKLTQIVPSVGNVSRYAEIVRAKFDIRRLINATREILDECMDGTADPAMLIDSAEQKIYDIRRERIRGGLTPISQTIVANYEILDNMQDPIKRQRYIGIPTGIRDLDNVISGLNRSDLIIVGARPGMGKTSFVLNLAKNVAIQQKRTVAIFNLEMSKEQMVNRLLSSEALVESQKLRSGELSPDEWTRIGVAASTLSNAEIYLDDTANITVQEMKSRLRRVKDLGVVFIDYLQLMHTAKPTENRVNEVQEITRSLKIMAKELDVPVVVCAQLSREKDKANPTRPQLSDLRESGSIEQDADQVMFIYRPEYYINQVKDPTKVEMGVAEIIVAKNRHGELKTVKTAWSGGFTSFAALDNTHIE